jgi:flagellar assembly protein FliH
MHAPAKFLFDNDFAGSSDGRPPLAATEHAIKLAEAEAAAYRNGFSAATAEAKANIEQRSVEALERIALALDELHRGLSLAEARIETDAIAVAVAVAKKLAPELVAREPLGEISALAANCFRHLVAAPHVVVRVNDALQAGARQQLEEIVRASGLDSRLVVLAEPEIAPGDCRIEWADGGINRDSAAAAEAIDEAVGRYLDARLATATMQENLWSFDR